ncbi:phosphatase PAP2 family protein [Streptomyces sp. NPDC056231]|uniref:phosphatase PAP2 family protein n=1 Tax=Streptomyces sp. NPDC056231 TaxID=3345755 RepID=UPI003AABE313
MIPRATTPAALPTSTSPVWWAALLFLGVAAVGWSRVSLRDHTTAQVIVGAVLGGTAAAVVFAGLR